jgi:hypothetical protein
MSDRVVIDSAAFDNPHYDLIQLAEMLEGRAAALNLSDLNWGRLTSWRSLVAGFWDVADYRASLSQIETVRVEYDPPDRAVGEVAPKALLATGWLASRLGWPTDASIAEIDAGGARFTLEAAGRTIEISLSPAQDSEGRDGMLRSLTIKTVNGSEFYVCLRPCGTKLETGATMVDGVRAAGRVLRYEARSERQRLGAELDILTRDVIYEEAVAAAARLLRAFK